MCEIEAGRAVKGKFGNVQYIYLDLRHIADLLEERLPMITDIAKKFNGIEAATEMIPVRPATHYTMGGISVNLDTETEVGGIFGAGENVAISIHGANRLGSNSTNECLAFGNIAGIMAARWAESHSIPDLSAGKVKLEEKKLSQKISVKDALIELSKICVIADGARRSVAEIPDRSQKIADTFGLKLYPKIARS
jgi:succinate dehydrogenase / fumarate reductase flavoprotein subunit